MMLLIIIKSVRKIYNDKRKGITIEVGRLDAQLVSTFTMGYGFWIYIFYIFIFLLLFKLNRLNIIKYHFI